MDLVVPGLLLADPVFFVPLLLLCVLFETSQAPGFQRTLTVALLIPATALTSHVKMTMFPLFILLILVVLFHEVRVCKRVPWIVLAVLACYFGFYLAAAQHMQFFWAYVSEATSMATAHNLGMFVSSYTAAIVVMGLLLSSVLPICYFIAVCSSRRWTALPACLWIAAYFFVAFKQAFVRQDMEHLWMGMISMAIPAAVVLLAILSGSYTLPLHFFGVRLARWNLDPVRTLCLFVALESVFFGYYGVASGILMERVRSTAANLGRLSLAFSGRTHRTEVYRREVTALKDKYPLASLNGTVDLLPWNVSLLLANRLQYRSRPIQQSQDVLNDRLARANANFLEGADAPDFILIDPQTIPQTIPRYPSMHDNLAWLALLRRYVPMEFSGSFLILKKSEREKEIQSMELLSETVSWHQPIRVPSSPSGPVWAQIDVSPSPMGNLAAILFHPELVTLNIEAAGEVSMYRFLPLIGSSGFLLSPMVDDPVSFAALYMGEQGNTLNRRVTRFWFTTSAVGRRLNKPDIHVRLNSLTIPGAQTSEILSDEFRQLSESMASSSTFNRPLPAPHWRVTNGHLQLLVNAPSKGGIELNRATRTLKLRLGVFNQCQDLPDASATIEFRVIRDAGDGGKRVLLRRQLFAAGAQDVSEEQSIDVSKLGTAKLDLETAVVAGNCAEGAYWSDLKPD